MGRASHIPLSGLGVEVAGCRVRVGGAGVYPFIGQLQTMNVRGERGDVSGGGGLLALVY